MRKFVLLLGCFAASPVIATEATLTGDAIKATLGGSLLAIDTPVGSTVSVRIGHDGLMAGDAGTALGAVLGASKDRGRWWVAENKVCFKWFRWFDAEARCTTISLAGNRFTWRKDDGDTGTGTIVEMGKPITKPEVIVAESKKPEPKLHHEVAIAVNTPTARTPASESRPAAPLVKAQVAEVPVVAKKPAAGATVVALSVPVPRPAARPRHHEKIAVASVKPQYFSSDRDVSAKALPVKVELATTNIAKTQIAMTPRSKPFRVAGVDPSDVLNVRTGPSPDYQTIGAIAPDSRGITITGPCQNDWCPVKHRTMIGWVNRRYLAEETAANTAAVVEPNYWDPTP